MVRVVTAVPQKKVLTEEKFDQLNIILEIPSDALYREPFKTTILLNLQPHAPRNT
jgi:hypothetical protein